MAAGQGVADYIDLDNFTAGVYSGMQANGGAQPAPEGAAQETDTYRCFGHPHGGLHPLPRIVATNTKAITTPATEPTYYPTGLARWTILDTQMVSPVVPHTGNETVDWAYSGNPDFMFYAVESYYDSGGASSWDRLMSVFGVRYFQSTPTEVTVDSTSNTTLVHASRQLFGYGSLDQGGTKVTANDALLPVLLYVLDPVSSTNTVFGCYPNVPDGTPDTDSQKDITGFSTGKIVALLSHQGRAVAVLKTTTAVLASSLYGPAIGDDSEMVIADDVFFKDGTNVVGNSAFAQYGVEGMTGWGSWVSLNAGELFIVKQAGGGLVVKGDLGTPTVTRIPGIPSTHLAVNRGAVTEKGYVFGTREGVWRWNGGDEVENLSLALEGWFWKPPDADLRFPDAVKGKFAYTHPWLFAPDNWVMDTRTGGWFRLTNPSDIRYAFYDVSATGNVYASPPYITVAQNTLNHRYDPTLGATDFKWRSQPLARTRNRRLDFREIILVAQGTGTVQVELLGYNASATHTFTIPSSTAPTIQRHEIDCPAHDVEVRITSTGTGGNAAPTVYRVSLGYRGEGPSVAKG